MTREDFREHVLRAVQRQRLLLAAVHRVDQLERTDAVIVLGARLDEHLLDRAHARVPALLRERNGRRHVRQDVDRVGGRCVDGRAVGRRHLDVVKAILVDAHRARQHPLRVRLQLDGRVVQHDPAGRNRHGGRGVHFDARAAQHRDVAAELDLARLQARVRREVVDEPQLLHVRQVLHVDAVDR